MDSKIVMPHLARPAQALINQLLASGRLRSIRATPPFSASQRTTLPSARVTRQPVSMSSEYSGALSDMKGLTETPRLMPMSDNDLAKPVGSGNLTLSHVKPYGA